MSSEIVWECTLSSSHMDGFPSCDHGIRESANKHEITQVFAQLALVTRFSFFLFRRRNPLGIILSPPHTTAFVWLSFSCPTRCRELTHGVPTYAKGELQAGQSTPGVITYPRCTMRRRITASWTAGAHNRGIELARAAGENIFSRAAHRLCICRSRKRALFEGAVYTDSTDGPTK